MLRLKSIALALLIVTPASARNVQIIGSGASSSSVIEVGRQRAAQVMPTAPSQIPAMPELSPALDNAMVNAFASMAPLPIGQGVEYYVPRTNIILPNWLRPGGYSGGQSAAFNNLTLPTTSSFQPVPSAQCLSQAVYRPLPNIRRDVQERRAYYYNAMAAIACEKGIPVALFDALIVQESGYNPRAISHANAQGMTQLIPGTARQLGVLNPWDPIANMRGGAKYLREHLDEFGQAHLALAAYNAGPGRVRATGRVPRFRETIGYVQNILTMYSSQLRREVAMMQF